KDAAWFTPLQEPARERELLWGAHECEPIYPDGRGDAVTSFERSNRLKTSILKAAVEDNVDTMAGRLPNRVGGRRQRLRRWSRRGGIALLPVCIIVASAGLARRPAAAPVASIMPSGPVATTAPLPPGSLDPALVSQPVPPDALALAVRRVIIDPGHGGDN